MFETFKNFIKKNVYSGCTNVKRVTTSFGLIGYCTIIIFLLCIIEQISNGLMNTKFVIKDLIETYNVLIPSILKYGLDSIFNTRLGSTVEGHYDDTVKPNVETEKKEP